MKTKIINLKQFRQNITSLWKQSQKYNIRYIVMFHSTPILEVRPYKDAMLTFDEKNMEFWQQEPKNRQNSTEIKTTKNGAGYNPAPTIGYKPAPTIGTASTISAPTTAPAPAIAQNNEKKAKSEQNPQIQEQPNFFAT